jgi:hypothetical protein
MTVTMTAPRTRVDPGGMPSPPDPEVPEKAKRRRFSADYKLQALNTESLARSQHSTSVWMTTSKRLGLIADRHGPPPRHRPHLRRPGRLGPVEVLPIEHDFWRFYRLLP